MKPTRPAHTDDIAAWPAGAFGQPIPDDPHAVSVWMPRWQDVIDYEEGTAAAQQAVKSGYPRFVFHPYYLELCARYAAGTDTDRSVVRVFPSPRTARECMEFVGGGSVIAEEEGLSACLFPAEKEADVKTFWQHAGPMVSSRRAEDVLKGRPAPDGRAAKAEIVSRLAGLYDGIPETAFRLFTTGMAAIYTAYRIAQDLSPGARTVQLGFPYLDTLKIQEKFGEGCIFIAQDRLDELEKVLAGERIAAVFLEVPTNPLLRTADMPALREILLRHKVPLIIDDTVGTPVNLDLTPYADILVASLTKFFCGSGVVAAGSLALNPRSDFYEAFRPLLDNRYEDLFYAGDAVELAVNARSFEMRMAAINRNAEALADYLHTHPQVESVYYPKFMDRDLYDALRRPGGGYGGLFSLVLKDRAATAAFYDALPVFKGPSLGTAFTLCCLYTLLAHYGELEAVEARGVSRDLVRVSVGAEDTADLLRRFEAALQAAARSC